MKMKHKRKWTKAYGIMSFAICIAAFLLCAVAANANTHAVNPNTENKITLVFEGILQKDSGKLFKNYDSIMMPIREFAALLEISNDQSSFYWDAKKSALYLVHNERWVTIYAHRRMARINQKNTLLKRTPYIKDGELYVSHQDLGKLFGLRAVYDESLGVLAFVDPKTYQENKRLLTNIQKKLEKQEKMDVGITFDFNQETYNFDFQVDKEAEMVNGGLLIEKVLSDRFVQERAEIFVRKNDFFVRDYELKKWRLDQSGSFNVIASFLRVFSNQHMLAFPEVGIASFLVRKYQNATYLQNVIVFNPYLKYELGFGNEGDFYFRMLIENHTHELKSISVRNLLHDQSVEQTARMNVFFRKYGEEVTNIIPQPADMVEQNASQLQFLNALKKAAELLLFDAQMDAVELLNQFDSVESLIWALKRGIVLEKQGQILRFGPYLTNVDITRDDSMGANYEVIFNLDQKSVNVAIANQPQLLIIQRATD